MQSKTRSKLAKLYRVLSTSLACLRRPRLRPSRRGLENKQTALLAIANEPTSEAQTQKVYEIVARRRTPQSTGCEHREKRLEKEIELLQAEGKERCATIDSLRMTITDLQAQLAEMKCTQSERQKAREAACATGPAADALPQPRSSNVLAPAANSPAAPSAIKGATVDKESRAVSRRSSPR